MNASVRFSDNISTTWSTATDDFGPFFDDVDDWEQIHSSGNLLVRAVLDELAQGGAQLPDNGVHNYKFSLGWENGLGGLISSHQDTGESVQLRVEVKAITTHVLPELLPLEQNASNLVCLDQLGPICRVLEDPSSAPHRARPQSGLAVVYQDREDFRSFVEGQEFSEGLANELRGLGIDVTTFPGNLLVDDISRHALLVEIFKTNKAVLFIGETVHSVHGSNQGWKLNDEDTLSLDDFTPVLAAPKGHCRKKEERGSELAELVFINGCCAMPGPAPAEGESLTNMFLKAGCRFVVGTACEIFFLPEVTRALLVEFFSEWIKHPDAANVHLFKAKKKWNDANGFHLQTALYQIYADPRNGIRMYEDTDQPPPVEITPAVQGVAPTGIVVASLRQGDQLQCGQNGEVILGEELCKDVYGRFFEAIISEQPGFAQVLSDSWREDPDIAERIRKAIAKLGALQLPKAHLIPEDLHIATLIRDGIEHQVLLLTFPYPDANPGDWYCPSTRPAASAHPEQGSFLPVIAAGHLAATLLAHLHSVKLVHGNFAASSILLRRHFEDGRNILLPLLKDAWVRLVVKDRQTPERYAAPESTTEEPTPAQDVWGLGCVLYELAAGRSPFDNEHPPDRGLTLPLHRAIGLPDESAIPEVLERGCIRAALSPDPAWRPSAEMLRDRLGVALSLGGAYLEDFAGGLHLQVLAGKRLFVSGGVSDFEELARSLETLTAVCHPSRSTHPPVRYRLYRAAEGEGLWDHQTREVLRPWVELDSQPLSAPSEARTFNADLIAQTGFKLAKHATNEIANELEAEGKADSGNTRVIPILVIEGSDWWEHSLRALRMFRILSRSNRGFVILFAAFEVRLPREMGFDVTSIPFPVSTPGDLYERIISAVEFNEGGSPDTASVEAKRIPAVEHETAAKLAGGFAEMGVSWEQAVVALRLSALEHGAIDERALASIDEARHARLNQIPGLNYTPAIELESADTFAVPLTGQAQIPLDAWWHSAPDALVSSAPLPNRILITGKANTGKSTLVRALASRVDRPLIRITPTACMSEFVGGTVSALRQVLMLASSLAPAVVAFEDCEAYIPLADNSNSAHQQSNPSRTDFAHMGSLLLHWLEEASESLIVIFTTDRAAGDIPGEWRRRINLTWELQPFAEQTLNYRAQVFVAAFKRHNLQKIATDSQLMNDLATLSLSGANIPAPIASYAQNPDLKTHRIKLSTAGDCVHWVREIMTLFSGDPSELHRSEFWRRRARLTPPM